MKVLIVDDIQMARLNMRRALECKGIQVIEADRGDKALRVFSHEKPDVVTLDIDLPDMSGIEVLKRMAEIDENVKVIMVTGISSQYNLIETLKGGAKYFLVKPIDLMKFVQVVEMIAK